MLVSLYPVRGLGRIARRGLGTPRTEADASDLEFALPMQDVSPDLAPAAVVQSLDPTGSSAPTWTPTPLTIITATGNPAPVLQASGSPAVSVVAVPDNTSAPVATTPAPSSNPPATIIVKGSTQPVANGSPIVHVPDPNAPATTSAGASTSIFSGPVTIAGMTFDVSWLWLGGGLAALALLGHHGGRR